MEILSTNKIFESRWLNVFSRIFKNSDGTRGEWIFSSRHSELPSKTTSNAVVIVPIWAGKDGEFLGIERGLRVVITKEFRVPINDYEYGFPAGLIDPEETIGETAKRELLEETGLEVVKIAKISPVLCSSAGMTDEAFNIVYLYCKGNPDNSKNEPGEEIETFILNVDEMRIFLKDENKVFGGKCWMILDMFDRYGRFYID